MACCGDSLLGANKDSNCYGCSIREPKQCGCGCLNSRPKHRKCEFQNCQGNQSDRVKQEHLFKLYLALFAICVGMAYGISIPVTTNIGKLVNLDHWYVLTSIIAYSLMIMLFHFATCMKSSFMKIALFTLFGFLAMLPIAHYNKNATFFVQKVPHYAFLGVAAVFMCFALASILSTSLKYTYLNGFLFSVATGIILLLYINIKMKKDLLMFCYIFALMLGATAFCLFETRQVTDGICHGDDNFLTNAFAFIYDLTSVVLQVFRILTNKRRKSCCHRPCS